MIPAQSILQELHRQSPELVDELFEFGVLKRYTAGSIVVTESAFIRSVPLVLSGLLRVIRTEEDGKEILLYYLQPGESCVMSVLGSFQKGPSQIQAEVEEDAEILFIPNDKVTSFLTRYPAWLNYVLGLYHKRFDELLAMVNLMAFGSVDDRLLELLRKKQSLHPGESIRVTHEQLADELGTARVVVSRLLKQMESQGLVRLGRYRIDLLV